MLPKLNKLVYLTVKSYGVIRLLNCLGMACEKVGANMLAEWCEINHLLYESQM